MGANMYNVLVADDEPAVIDSATTYIRQIAQRFRDNVQIFPAESASEVLDTLSKHKIDVVFLDYHFQGGMNGDEIIDRMKDPFDNKLVILMSGRGQNEIEGVITKRHKHMGTRFRFLRKPFDELEIKAKYFEIEQFFSSQPYPFPLAYPKQILSASLTGQRKIAAIKDLVESLLKYGVALIMSDLSRLKIVDGLQLTIKLHHELTLGAWLQWFDQVIRYFTPHLADAHMPELIELFESGDGASPNIHLRRMYEFKEYRDKEYAHGFMAEDDKYTLVANRYKPELELLLQSLRFTSRYTLFTPVYLGFAGDGSGDFAYEVKVLMGTETVFVHSHIQLPMRLNIGEIYSYNPGGACLALSPFFTYQLCETCGTQRFYILDRILPSQLEYNCFCNHRRFDKRARSEFDAKFGKIVGKGP
jgi:CheY-like chemotaxis protein